MRRDIVMFQALRLLRLAASTSRMEQGARKIAVTRIAAGIVVVAAMLSSTGFARLASSAVTDGVDVKVTRDNNNVDAGYADPGFDGRNLGQAETTVAISPV